MKFKYNDGGRKKAGYKGDTGDCVCRSIAIATEKPYQEIYDLINEFGLNERITERKKDKSHSRTGVYKNTIKKIMKHLGWEWQPTMFIGSGCKVHMRKEELPNGRLILNISKHVTTVIDGVLHDTYDCSRKGNRCVYGYYYKK
jgi:hypothetical protein